jgi:type II secretory pathway component GspD/PulD (secretin)
MVGAQVTLPDGRVVDTTSALWQQLRASGQNPVAALSIMPNVSAAQFPATPPAPNSGATPLSAVPASSQDLSQATSVSSIPAIPVSAGTCQAQCDSLLRVLVPDSLMLPSLNLRGTEVRDVLSALGLQYGVNLLIDPSVSGTVTLNLRNTRLRDAIRLIAHEAGLTLDPLPGALKVWRPPPPQPAPPPEPKCIVHWNDGMLSLDMGGASIDKVARAIAESTQVNVEVDKGVVGNVTLLVQKAPLAKALSMVADNAGLQVRSSGGIYTFSALPWKPTDQGGGGFGAHVSVDSDSLLTVEANETPLKQLVPLLGSKLGVNMVVVGALTGTATLRVTRVPLGQVLDFLLSGTDFTWWQREGAWFVGPVGTAGVTNTELIVLKHLKAEDVLDMVPANVVRNAQLKLVKSHNAIMVLGSRESIEGIRQFVESVDYPVPMILIEALVVDVNLDKVRNIGVTAAIGASNLGGSNQNLYPNFEQIWAGNDVKAALGGIPGLRGVVNLPANFALKLSALEQESIVDVRSRPQVATMNGSEATIDIGQTQYFLLNTSTNLPGVSGTTVQTNQQFQQINADQILTVTPYVTGKGEITCDIVPDFSEPVGTLDPNTPPTINHRKLKSKVRLRDGETIILGGLISETINNTYNQVPLLGSIPFLGQLFKNRATNKSRSQLLIFVTPHIYYGADANVDPVKVLNDLDK